MILLFMRLIRFCMMCLCSTIWVNNKDKALRLKKKLAVAEERRDYWFSRFVAWDNQSELIGIAKRRKK